MPATVITRAHEVERLAQPIIDEHHTHLNGARILYLFTTQERKHHTKTVLATAQKTNALQRFLSSEGEETSEAGHDFIILVGQAEWEELTLAQRVALVDHELCHCWMNEKGDYCLRSHDVEEFACIVHRHGLWKQDVKTFASVVQQLPLELGAKVPVGV